MKIKIIEIEGEKRIVIKNFYHRLVNLIINKILKVNKPTNLQACQNYWVADVE
jgi:hypothetical protein